MPASNAVNLMPPKPISTANVNNVKDSSQDDSGPSFEQTLDNARKTAAPSTDSQKPMAKKVGKTDSSTRSDQDEDQQTDGAETDSTAKTGGKAADGAPGSTASKKKSAGPKKADHQAETTDPFTAATIPGQQLIASQTTPPTPKTDQKTTGQTEETPQAMSSPVQAVAVNANPTSGDATTGSASAGNAQQAAAMQAGQEKSDLASVKAPGIGTAKVETTSKAKAAGSQKSAGAQSAATATQDADANTDADSTFNDLMQEDEDLANSGAGARPETHLGDSTNDLAVAMNLPSQLTQPGAAAAAKTDVPLTPQAQFVQANHPTIVTGVQSQLLPNGGTMMIRLDPPELGALQVTVHLRNGVMTAAFETSNDDATRLLSHSLDQLKTSLESVGVNVEKLHVQQAPRQDSHGDSGEQRQQQGQEQQQQTRQEQQRREMLRRMWRKLSGGGDPLDMVA